MDRVETVTDTRHSYEVMPDSKEGAFSFVGRNEQTAVVNAARLAAEIDEPVRLYHTHPSPARGAGSWAP